MAKPALRIRAAMPKKVKPAFPFGARLAKLRADRGLTQVQLAERIGSTQPCISSYETNVEYPPTAVLVAIAKELKVTTDELLGLAPASDQLGPGDSPEERRLWKNFRKVIALPDRDRKAVIRLVNSLVGTTEG